MNDQLATRPVNFIRFHGLNLLVVEHDGVEYVAARPLVELAGMPWKRARKTLFSAGNVTLYGTCELETAIFDGPRPLKGAEKAVYFRFDRARMFLARINTDRMRANGNVEAADRLLALQVEWAKVLQDYETKGFAGKPGVTRDLIGLIKARAATENTRERAALTAMIAETCADLGHPLPPDPQGELALPAKV